jgi:hypothetical protein
MLIWRKPFLGFTTAVLSAAALLVAPQAASASEGPGATGGGITVTWQGTYTSDRFMTNIAVKLCDGDPRNTNLATAQFKVWLRSASGYRYSTYAPTKMLVPQFEKNCKNFGNMKIGYNDYIEAIQMIIWGSADPDRKWGGTPFDNPYDCGAFC